MHQLKAVIHSICIIFLILATLFKVEWNHVSEQYSTTLTRMVNEVDNVEHITYVDEQGKITYASDLHYASIVRTKDDDGRISSVLYFDENGHPETQPNGSSGWKRQYDDFGRNNIIIYTDRHGEPVTINLAYAILENVFDEDGRVIEQWYFDTYGHPTENSYGAFGILHNYDSFGRNISSTHVDRQKKPVRISLGFATINREFYENGLMKRAFYCDEEGVPSQSVYNQYGYYYEYDDKGRRIVTTFIDSDGNPMVASVGYATVKKTYDDLSGVAVTEMYFDENGAPISLSKGQYGVRFDGDDQVYLDENGHEQFSLYTLLYNSPMLVVFFGLMICAISMALNKKGNCLLLIGYLFFIMYMTLMNRNVDETRITPVFLWSYKEFFKSESLRQEILNNIWLFIPLGTILYRLIGWFGILTAFGLSAAIEMTQLISGVGLAEYDDLLSNSLGSFIGCGIANLINQNRIYTTFAGKKPPKA